MSTVPNAFLDTPPDRQYCLEYIKTVLETYSIDVLILLEAVGSTGDNVAFQLSYILKNWKYKISSGQRAESRRERYIIFWRETPQNGIMGLTPQPEKDFPSCWLYSTVDDNSLKNFFDSVGWGNNRNKQVDLYNTLVTSGYIAKLIDVNSNIQEEIKTVLKKRKRRDNGEDEPFIPERPKPKRKRRAPRASGSTVASASITYTSADTLAYDALKYSFNYSITGSGYNRLANEKEDLYLIDELGNPKNLGLTTTQLTKLKNILININLIKFGTEQARSPFLVSLDLKKNSTTFPFLIAAFHAPNPTESQTEFKVKTKLKYAAINNLSECPALTSSLNLLIAGDFNVSYKETTSAVTTFEYEFYDVNGATPGSGKEDYGYWPSTRLNLANPYINIEQEPIEAPSVLGVDEKTSIKDALGVLGRYSKSNFAYSNFDYLKETYDKFFFRSKGTNRLKEGSNSVVDLVAIMNKQNDVMADEENSIYDEDIAQAGMRYFKSNLSQSVITEKVKQIGGKDYAKLLLDIVPSKYIACENSPVNAKRIEIEYLKKQQITKKETELVNMVENSLDLLVALQPKTVIVPANSYLSFFAYAGFSDHLPIYMDIQY